jgi:hypothetical protein
MQLRLAPEDRFGLGAVFARALAVVQNEGR